MYCLTQDAVAKTKKMLRMVGASQRAVAVGIGTIERQFEKCV